MNRLNHISQMMALACATAAPAIAKDEVLNLYSARHYQTDEALYADFTKATGIKINRIVAGDDQIKAVASSECGVALTNTYYWVRIAKSTKPEDVEILKNVGVIWPNQSSYGTHVNVPGGAMLKNAPNKEAAIKFLEYLAGDEVQGYFANGNNERPAVKSAVVKNPTLVALGPFKADNFGPGIFSKNTPLAQRIVDRAG